MSLDRCRQTVQEIEAAHESLLKAIDDGQWLEGRTLSRMEKALTKITAAVYHADDELFQLELALKKAADQVRTEEGQEE